MTAKERLAKLIDEADGSDEAAAIMLEMMVEVYNSGYTSGHQDTVNGGYVDVHWQDKSTYHSDDVESLLSEMVKQ